MYPLRAIGGDIFRFLVMPVLAVFLFCVPARAGAPTDQLRATTDGVIKILKDEALKAPEMREKRRAAIRRLVIERFDFLEMTKRSLARHWRNRTPEERAEFVDLYTDLLERTYVKHIENYRDEKIEYVKEIIRGKYALVKTRIVGRSREISLDFKLMNQSGRWRVYDLVIEGVGLINNYRTQFNKIIVSGSYEELVERLRNKRQLD